MKKKISISLRIKTPFLTGNAKAPELGLDGLMLRNLDGNLMFPGSMLRGILRDAIETMNSRSPGGLAGMDLQATTKVIRQLFGQKSMAEIQQNGANVEMQSDAYAPDRPMVRFGDLVSNDAFPDNSKLAKTRIQRLELTGSAIEGSFQKIELIAPHGTEIPFLMDIALEARVNAENIKKLIELAFGAITSIGSAKSAGFGRIAGVPILTIEDSNNCQPFAIDRAQNSVRLRLKLNGPLLINTDRDGSNAAIGRTIIPGGAIKAAIADALGEESELLEGLSDLTISHAHPLINGQFDKRPIVVPFSVSAYQFADCMEVMDEAAIGAASVMISTNQIAAPKFEVDWKQAQREKVETIIADVVGTSGMTVSSTDLAKQTKVRTAIDRKTGGAAKNEEDAGQLFVQQSVLPRLDDKTSTPVEWVFDIRATNNGYLSQLIDVVSRSELRIGKLQSPASLENSMVLKTIDTRPWYVVGGQNYYCVVLQSPAVMFEAADMRATDLKTLYAEYIRQVFFDNVQLEQVFAKQQLRGGYQALRYRGNRQHYAPWIITEPGSTFVISIPASKADALEELLATYCEFGLPVTQSAGVVTWKDCPFVPQNGYGGIAVNPLAYNAFPLSDDVIMQEVPSVEVHYAD